MINDVLKVIQSELKAPKGQFNKFGGYNYRNCEDILEAVKPLLKKYSATITLSDELMYVGERYYIKATATLKSGGEMESVTAYAREEETKKGMDGSQITGASSSYARKYALNGLFAIDDTKDSDSTNRGKDDNPTDVNSDKPMTFEEALAFTITGGERDGKTLRELWKTDFDFIKWLKHTGDARAREAISVIEANIKSFRKNEAVRAN